jgi:peptide/nickel transport system substrate-binding protein
VGNETVDAGFVFDKTVNRRQLVKGAAALAGVAALTGPVANDVVAAALVPNAQDDRGTLILRARSFPATFNPLINDVRVWLYDGLVRFDADMNPIPDLAESWTISDDGLVYTIKLRQDVTFHDGTPMTADDVLFTAQLTLDEKVGSAYRSKFVINGTPVAWAKVDDYTVTATLPQPSASFLAKLSRADEIFFCILPKHLLEGVEDITTAPFNQNPVGTGPFKFVEYKADESLTMTAHDAYHGGKPGVAQVVRVATPNEQSALAALKAGEIDISTLNESGNVKAADEDSSLTVYRYNSNWVFAGRFNFANPILQDPLVRQAICHAIDRENLIHAAISPTAVVGNSPISYGWAASPNVTVYEFDLEKAASLLDQAGWTGSGVREKDGTKLSFALTIDPGYGAPDLAAGIQALLSQVGVEIEINQLEAATLETTVYQDRNFDIYLGWQGFGVDPDIASRWKTVPADSTASYLDNPASYSNPEVDAALDAAATALTQEDRAANLWKAQDLITADCPAIWLQQWEAISAVGGNVGGLSLPPSTADMDNTGIFREPWTITSTRK